jgi:hypothetical protein
VSNAVQSIRGKGNARHMCERQCTVLVAKALVIIQWKDVWQKQYKIINGEGICGKAIKSIKCKSNTKH